VKFHNGNDFTADDVVFSATRVRAQGSNFQTRVPTNSEFVKVDDHTVDVKLKAPNPILNAQWDTWYIMDKEWAEQNNTAGADPGLRDDPELRGAQRQRHRPLPDREPPARRQTVFKPNDKWWDKAEHNLTEIVFTPIGSDATRVAALLSGEVDVIEPVPLQDIQRVNSSPNAKVMTGPELRTIFLGFDQTRDELLFSNVKGKNPFKDKRVRQAFYQAIDMETIKSRVMRGLATPSPLMIAPELVNFEQEFQRPKFDVEASKKLLADAGYPNGFEVGMDCPNDRYVNDEAICQAVVGMLARAGIKVNLLAQPKAQYFAKVLKAGNYQTSFYLLGWTPGTFDAHNVLHDIEGCRDNPQSSRGESNSAATATRSTTRSPTRRSSRTTRPSATAHEGRVQDHLQRVRLHPAAPAGAGLGRVQQGEADPARGQLGAALLGPQGVSGASPLPLCGGGCLEGAGGGDAATDAPPPARSARHPPRKGGG
jgi:peptide/nickel transport system substrate-binding protein